MLADGTNMANRTKMFVTMAHLKMILNRCSLWREESMKHKLVHHVFHHRRRLLVVFGLATKKNIYKYIHFSTLNKQIDIDDGITLSAILCFSSRARVQEIPV